jgi:hypothetical protein
MTFDPNTKAQEFLNLLHEQLDTPDSPPAAVVWQIAMMLGDESPVWLNNNLAGYGDAMTGTIVVITPTRFIVAEVEDPRTTYTWARSTLRQIDIDAPAPVGGPDADPLAHLAPELPNSDAAWKKTGEHAWWPPGTQVSLKFSDGPELLLPLHGTRRKPVLVAFLALWPELVADLR